MNLPNASFQFRDPFAVNVILTALFLLGGVLTCFVWRQNWATALLWALAMGGTGFAVGFLFGFPRVIQRNENESASSSGLAYRLSVNTNLEQVSDWLTKIVVGITLVELRHIPENLQRLAYYASTSTGRPSEGASAEGAAAAMLVYFSVLGFLTGYLITRMFFQKAFADADQFTMEKVIQSLTEPQRLQPVGEGPAKLEGAAAVAAKKIESLSREEAMARGIPAIALARAKLSAGDTSAAIESYGDAILKNPSDPALYVEYATALRAASAPIQEIVDTLKNALNLERKKPDPQLRRRIYDFLTYMLLYLPAPQGFTEAIDYIELSLKEGLPPTSDTWGNLACGYGQKARYIHDTKSADNEEFRRARDATLSAAKKAIEFQPIWRVQLLNQYDPPPELARLGEGDLTVFRDIHDEAFEKLLRGTGD